MSSDEDESSEYDERHGFWGEDGQWYDRRDNQYTKEEQIYGVFNQNTSNRNTRSRKKKYNSNTPIINPNTSNLNFNFVKGGIQTVKNLEEESTPTNTNTHINDQQQSILKEWESVKQQKQDLLASRTGPQLGKFGLPKQLGKQKQNQKTKYKSTKSSPIIGVKKDQGYASWTKTEKRAKFGGMSFAEKYMQKHGFKGRLGVTAQGIANPIKQASRRKYNEGLGYNNIDQQKEQPKNVEQELKHIKKRTEKEKENIKQQQKMWKIIDENDNNNEYIQPLKKRKISYQTASEFYTKKNDGHKGDIMQIYDYTQEEVRITTSDKVNKIFNEICPAFKHNVDRICDLTEEKRIILNRQKENLKQEKYNMKLQLDSVTKQKCMDNTRGKKLCELKTLMYGLSGDISSDIMYDIFETLQNKFYVEYLKYKLWMLFPSVVFSRVKIELKEWKLIENGCDIVIDLLVKWKRLLVNNYLENNNNNNNNNKKDVYDVFIDEVIIGKIRSELYEWHPLEINVNGMFIKLFKELKNVMPMGCYMRLINNLIVSRLNHILEERDVNDIECMNCIIGWDFVFSLNGLDGIFGGNICKKMKLFWRGFDGKCSENEHRMYINVLQKWESVLLDIIDDKCMDNMYNVLVEMILVKFRGILTDCVHGMEEGKNEYLMWFEYVNLWYICGVLNKGKYLKLVQKGFFDKWVFLVYERLKDLEGCINGNGNDNVDMVDDIKFIWNNLFAVIKNVIFGKDKNDKIRDLLQCDVFEKYLNCGLDMINWVMSNDGNILLPVFDVIKNILMDGMMNKKKKKKKKKDRYKNKRDRNDENKYEKDNIDNVMNDDVMKSIGIVELIEMKAENLGVEFYLDFNKQYDGKKVYKFGKLYICFYDKTIFAKQGNEWKPVDIKDLTRMC